MSEENIGIFGGTFDPLHVGHLKIATLVQKNFHLNRLVFVPAGTPPHKKRPLASEWQRWTMARLGIKGYKKFFVSSYEIKHPGPSYSVETLKHFKKSFKNRRLFFIIGLDSLLEIRTWHKPEEILKLCQLIVVFRPTARTPQSWPPEKVFKIIKKLSLGKFSSKIHYVKIRGFDISSTAIRARLSKGQPWRHLVPAGIARYIRENKLYCQGGKNHGKPN